LNTDAHFSRTTRLGLLLYNFTVGKHREQCVRQLLAADDTRSLGRHDPPLVLLEDPLQQPLLVGFDQGETKPFDRSRLDR
jgi:hypothetical protein